MKRLPILFLALAALFRLEAATVVRVSELPELLLDTNTHSVPIMVNAGATGGLQRILVGNLFRGLKTNANTVYVSVSGNNVIGMRGRPDLPFLTLTAAKNAASAGDTIIVWSGTYNENDLLKNGVNWCFMPGARINYTSAPTTAEKAIFDDNGAACTNRIYGYGEFIFSSDQTDHTAPEGVAGQVLQLANGASDVSIEGYRAAGGTDSLVGTGASVLTSIYASRMHAKFERINQLSAEVGSALVWRGGNCSVTANEITATGFPVYFIGASNQCDVSAIQIGSATVPAIVNDGTASSKASVRAHRVTGGSDAANHKGNVLLRGGVTDINIDVLENTSGATFPGAAVCTEGGSHYVNIGRMVTTLGGVNTAGFYVRSSGGWLTLDCDRFDSVGGFHGVGVEIVGGTNLISGKFLRHSNAIAFRASGSQATTLDGLAFEGFNSSGSGNTNECLLVMTNGVTVKNISLKPPSSSVNGLKATNANNHVNIEGLLYIAHGSTNTTCTITNGVYKEGGNPSRL
jgi:hypothetical protein